MQSVLVMKLLMVLGLVGCAATADVCSLPPPSRAPIAAGVPDDARASRLAGVQSWQYFLDVDITAAQIDAIAASDHDLLVIDFIPSEENNRAFDMAALVARMHAAPTPKLVLAYIDIGQAESFRSYYRDAEWGVGDPDSPWIVGTDPDGWVENYPVAFWDPRWQRIWLDDDGLIAQITASGMDGIYLDWVEAYTDPRVVAAAQAAGVDPRAEMIAWVGRLAAAARARAPQSFVIAQNASELAATSPAYRAIIDGLAQEQTWFDGAADGDPAGDCPLPPTEDDVETAAYIACLSTACAELHDAFPDSTLHTSTDAYLADLDATLAAGTPVFTVDYAVEPHNIAFATDQARQRGYIPFVGPRALDRVAED